ncbi:MAG: alpha/beta hydrolase [Myxococcota bacterium]
MSFVPSAEVVGSGPRAVWFVHGILGQGRNWRSFARRLCDAEPSVRAVLPDLRCHGASTGAPPPHDLPAAAADLVALGQPALVVGHSLGGKVALLWARDHDASGAVPVWSLDSPPGADPSAPGAAVEADPEAVLALLRSVPVPAAARDALRAPLRAAGLPEPIVAWLLSSSRHDPDGWRWLWDLDGVAAMLASYREQDLWPFVEATPRVHLVRAGRSDRWSERDLARLRALGSSALGPRAHEVPDAGHWLHVDQPDAVMALVRQALRQAT